MKIYKKILCIILLCTSFVSSLSYAVISPSIDAMILKAGITYLVGSAAVWWANRDPVSSVVYSSSPSTAADDVISGLISAVETNYNAHIAQIVLDNTKPVPLSQVEVSSGFTSNTTSIIPPSSGLKNYKSGSHVFGAATMCDVPIGGIVTDPTGQYAYTATLKPSAGVSGPVPSLSFSDSASGWANSANSCGSAGSFGATIYLMSSPCTTGYVYNTTTKVCNVSNAAIVNTPADGICKIIRKGNAFLTPSTDPDCKSPSITPIFTNSNGTLTIVDPERPREVQTISIDTAGRITASQQRPIENSNFNNVDTVIMGNVVNTSGTSSINTIGATSTINTGLGTGSVANTNTNTSSGNTTIDIPSNLAKTEDVNKITSALTTDPGVSPPPLPDGLDNIISSLKDEAHITTIPSIFSFSPPLLTSQSIPDISMPLGKDTVSFNIEVWASYIRDFMGILLYLFTPWTILQIFRGREVI